MCIVKCGQTLLTFLLFTNFYASTENHGHTHTHTHTQPFYGSLNFVWDILDEPLPEKTFTHHTYHSHQSSLICFFHLLFTIHGILPVQFTCLAVFFQNLSPSFLWSTFWPGTLHFILHTFLHPITFHSICPYHPNLFCCSTKIMSSNPNLSTLHLELLTYSLMPRIHLTILISAC